MARLAGHLLTDDPRKKRPGERTLEMGSYADVACDVFFWGGNPPHESTEFINPGLKMVCS